MSTPQEAATNIANKVGHFFRYAFTTITIEGPKLDPEEIQRHAHMIVSTHRSHVDYFLTGWYMHSRGFKNMRFAAGSNLTNLPWIGSLFRGLGAFTVMREMAFERNYVQNLCNQVVGMMENKDAVILFPEGGRSYSGAMLDLKSGILGAAILLQARHPDDDVFLIPSAISYEYPPDAPWFDLLLKGKKLRRHNNNAMKRVIGTSWYYGADILAFLPFVMARRTGRQYGAVYMDYDAPLSVRAIVDVAALRAKEAKDEFFSHRAAMQQVAQIVRQRFLALFRLLPMHALATLIIRHGPLSAAQAVALIPGLMEELRSRGKNCRSLTALTPHDIVAKGRDQLLRLKALHQSGGVLFEKKGSVLRYCGAPVFDGEEKKTLGVV
jgi:1-acyl-sn-glycerol-3-phosphate acyltransferase